MKTDKEKKIRTGNGEPIFRKEREDDKIYWVTRFSESGIIEGPLEISFDKKHIFNLWQDYPHKFTKEQKELFDKENPFWAEFFGHRENK